MFNTNSTYELNEYPLPSLNENFSTVAVPVVPMPPSDFSEDAYLKFARGDDALVDRLKGTAANAKNDIFAALGIAEQTETLRSEFGHQSGSNLRGKAANTLHRTIAELEAAGLDAEVLRRMTNRRTRGARSNLDMEPRGLKTFAPSRSDFAYEA